jgi:4-hydroxy-3-methylbut-2-enyl diphosphate reductase
VKPGTLNKKLERKRIMKEERYKRGATPFDRSVHAEVTTKMSEMFKAEVVDDMKNGEAREVIRGEGRRAITFQLAKDYGFCWGVERSIELAWAACDAYPDKTVHITNELIHNPKVNDLLKDMDVNFIEKTAEGKRFGDVEDNSVVILPAFGATLEEMQHLDSKGVTVVDTTCPWVSKVWTTVDKHAQNEMTSVIHGKWNHEESLATSSMAQHYIIVKNLDEAQDVASFIMGEEGSLTAEQLLEKYKNAVSEGFNPDEHLRKIGIANQTTMYKKETQAIGKLMEKAMIHAHGPEYAAENFAAFDTICSATQVRQDAVQEMSSPEVAKDLDFILVVGGWDSSNTCHLLEIPEENGMQGYHVDVPSRITPDGSITHRKVDGSIETTENFLPMDRPVRIGVTSGASTPDSVVQECLEQLILLKALAPETPTALKDAIEQAEQVKKLTEDAQKVAEPAPDAPSVAEPEVPPSGAYSYKPAQEIF